MVLLALMGYGVATSAITSSPPKVAPVTSTSLAPATTVPAPTTTEPEPLVPYYAADPPREFAVQYAEIDTRVSGYEPGFYQLWATDDASASSGRWFSIESYPGGGPIYAMNAYRVESDERSIAISRLSAGQSIAQFMIGTAMTVTLTSFGLSDEDLVRLSLSVSADGREATLTDESLTADFRMISEVPPWLAVQGIPVEQVFYASQTDLNEGLSISVSPRQSPGQGGATLDRQIALRFFLDHATPFAVDGHAAVAGAVTGQPEYAMATWIARDHIVTVAGAMSVAELIAIARTVHQVSSDEWSGMRFQATRNTNDNDNNSGRFEETQLVPVSFGTDGRAESWTIQVAMSIYPDQRQIRWQWDRNSYGHGSLADPIAKIDTVVDDRRTYVLADLPRGIAPTAQLWVTRAGLDPVVVDFIDTGADLDRTFAAYAFSEPTQYTAQIIGADGTVIASWPP